MFHYAKRIIYIVIYEYIQIEIHIMNITLGASRALSELGCEKRTIMNITIVSLWAQKLFRPDEPQPHGGAELQLYLLANEWASYPDTQVHFITRGTGPSEDFEHNKIHVHKLPYYGSGWQRMIFGSRDLYRTAKSIPSQVYIQRGGGIETGLTGWVAKKTKTPFLFMCSHDWDVDDTHAKSRGLIYGKMYLSGLKNAPAVITQSEFQQKYMLEKYGHPSAVLRSAHTIPNEIPTDKKGVLWVGRCETFKNPEVFLEIVKNIPDIPFTMVCPEANSKEKMERVKHHAAQLPNLTFLPGIPFAETEKLFASHKLFVCTSSKEGFPNTYVQALKWGAPIISLNVNPDGILTQHQMGLCLKGNGMKQIMSIQECYKDEERRQVMSGNARAYANNHHNIHTIARHIYEMMASLQPNKNND